MENITQSGEREKKRDRENREIPKKRMDTKLFDGMKIQRNDYLGLQSISKNDTIHFRLALENHTNASSEWWMNDTQRNSILANLF